MKNNIETCSCNVIHQDIVEKVSKNMVPDEKLLAISELYKVLGDFARIKIVNALMESEMCVCDLTTVLNMTQSAVSHQLRVLKMMNLVKFRRKGKIVYYSLYDKNVKKTFKVGLEYISS
ncbi:MAG TPA: metalloregulator ArsR/SmtB family transcription factor [Victivallales bacterium]|nr:metalloregulator ArsR/SmtB family transcription factor [Victivallales bacterium]